jgi:hypothetical protein
MSLVPALCKKCAQAFKIDIGSSTKDEAIAKLSKMESFECPGHHVELTSPLRYWDIHWDQVEDGSSPSEEEWLDDLKRKHREVYTTDDLRTKFTNVSFAYGMCAASLVATGETKILDFDRSPEGKRYYF